MVRRNEIDVDPTPRKLVELEIAKCGKASLENDNARLRWKMIPNGQRRYRRIPAGWERYKWEEVKCNSMYARYPICD
jgi:hypothetical protein